MDGMKKCDPALKAKMDVVKALRKMAMELMAQGDEEGGDEAVVAELEMKKLPKADALAGLGESEGEEEAELAELDPEEEEEGEEDASSMLSKMIAAKKKLV